VIGYAIPAHWQFVLLSFHVSRERSSSSAHDRPSGLRAVAGVFPIPSWVGCSYSHR